MTLSYPDAFAYSEQKGLLFEPIFTSDLICGNFDVMGQDFINWFLYLLNKEDNGKKYPNLRKNFNRYIIFFDNGVPIKYEYFLLELKLIVGKKELENEFYDLVSSMEATLNFANSKNDDNININVRRILSMWNGVDFAQYLKGISGFSEDTPVSRLLRFGRKEIDGDDTKTLGDELKGDIELISKRISELLGITAIKDGVIIDDNISLFSALDGFSGGEVFLTIDGKIIDAKPPKGRWNDNDIGNESNKIVFEVGGDIIPF